MSKIALSRVARFLLELYGSPENSRIVFTMSGTLSKSFKFPACSGAIAASSILSKSSGSLLDPYSASALHTIKMCSANWYNRACSHVAQVLVAFFFCPLRVEVSTLTMFSDTEGSFFLVVAFSISNRVMNALRGRFALSRRLIHLEIRFALSRVSFLILGHLESVLFYRGQNNRYTYVELF